ncbi:phenylalanine--tRNA ligase subunit beta [Bhargavaea beijingensis]|uniref:Phenylalanine--tRNA ligase beta subunit n=1 Tax=Bhargavaea beijingensis TaxID=426756 RepID=A0A1G7D6T8_9BACL|nr:phenylalanine--tRNA ligase subunit beta [Bhargavaea beijingensis]RSK24457.1 phenylalanine--tRNA ligase subunit beta [Bhargavaea beijingensis]SDE46475.1 phenylalanyl-tRNA synthetase beta subunit [Bhargavaea beijingensis]
MKISLNWLSDYVDIEGVEPAELAEKITRSGIEVDAVDDRSKGLKNIVVGHVLECNRHPQADKLNICRVDVGEEEPSQIICGAPNVAAGQKVVVARPGARLPGGVKIKKAKLRGEESHGMICSLQELGFDGKVVPKAYASGIYVLPADARPGEDALALLGLDDTVLELDLTPNRSDALSMLGVAYETAAILSRDVKLPETAHEEAAEPASGHLSLRIDAPEANPLYAAKIVRNVKVGESPEWLKARLMAAGVRPLNNIVDITNYVLMEYGQPLHAFDYDRLGTGEIAVRHAAEGEVIQTLDGTERKLEPHHLLITNGRQPVAIAGVMGGANSEVHDGTTTVVIEAAYFDPASVRKTSRELGLRSDASTRFEKGVDTNRVIEAGERAAALMADLAGGEVLSGTVLFDALDKEPKRVTVSPDFINERLGMKIPFEEMEEILDRLQFPYEAVNGQFVIDAPTRRVDISIPEDIVEEIARLYGYDEIPATLPVMESLPGGLTLYQKKRRSVRRYLEGAGLYQAITYSLTSEQESQQFALETAPVTRLLMPMSEERSTLRQSLLPHLLEAVTYNTARQTSSVALYEVGSVFLGKGEDGLPAEVEHAAGAVTGEWTGGGWQGGQKPVDFYTVKGIVEGLAAELGLSGKLTFRKGAMDGLHPGRTADVLLDGERVGIIGQLHPSEQKARDLKDTIVFELNLERLLKEKTEPLLYTPVPKFPSISRDIALVVPKAIQAATLQTTIRANAGNMLKDIRVFDVYEGDRMEEGLKSIAFSLTYLDPERTLTDEEVSEAHCRIVAALEEEGAQVRN